MGVAVSSSTEMVAEKELQATIECGPALSRAAQPGPEDDLPVTVIERRSGWQFVDLRELWRFRELLFFLTWRDIKVRYKQTVLGAAWAVLQPLSTVIVFAFFLGRLGGISEGMTDYPLFVLAGILPWTFFANAVSTAGNSVVANERLVSKIYFPRLIIPVSSVGASLFDFLISLVILAVMMAVVRRQPGVVGPAGAGLDAAADSDGGGRWDAAVGPDRGPPRLQIRPDVRCAAVDVRDAVHLPEGDGAGADFPDVAAAEPRLRAAAELPDSGAERSQGLDWYALGVSAAVGLALLLVGCFYFRRVERTFADVI